MQHFEAGRRSIFHPSLSGIKNIFKHHWRPKSSGKFGNSLGKRLQLHTSFSSSLFYLYHLIKIVYIKEDGLGTCLEKGKEGVLFNTDTQQAWPAQFKTLLNTQTSELCSSCPGGDKGKLWATTPVNENCGQPPSRQVPDPHSPKKIIGIVLGPTFTGVTSFVILLRDFPQLR